MSEHMIRVKSKLEGLRIKINQTRKDRSKVVSPAIFETHRDGFTISTDPARLQVDSIYDFLTNRSYWSPGIARAVVEKSIANSLCFGVYTAQNQVGFGRVISDFAILAYLADVFIIEEYRGRGLSKWLVEVILAHPDLQDVRRWLLATRDAHSLYARYGFHPLNHPEFAMERFNQENYTQNTSLARPG